MGLCKDDILIEKVDDLKSELDMIKDKLFANFNERLVEATECIRALDDRTKMFCPSKSCKNESNGFEMRIMNRLELHAKKINEIKKVIGK